MPVILSQAQRIAISRRLVKLPKEISIFNTAITNTTASTSALTDVDSSNDEFLKWWIGISDCYLKERQEVSGESATPTFDFIEASVFPPYPNTTNPAPSDKFFPWDPFPTLSNSNFMMIPKISDYTIGTPVLVSPLGETDVSFKYQQLIDLLKNGVVSSAGAPANTKLASNYNSGDTSITVSAGGGAGISDGQNVIISGQERVLPIPPPPYTYSQYVFHVDSHNILNNDILIGRQILASAGATTIVSGVTSNVLATGGVIWSNTDRANNPFTGGASYTLTRDAITTYMMLATWHNHLDAEIIVLPPTTTTGNYDERSIQRVENITARSAAATMLLAIDTWQAMLVTIRYTNTGLASLQIAANTRVSFLATRIAQLKIAMGLIIDNGDGTYTPSSASPYDGTGALVSRYQNLDRKINKSHGSASRASNMSDTKNIIQQQHTNSIAAKDDYETSMFAVPIVEEPDGTNIIWIGATQRPSGSTPATFATGNAIYVVADDIATTEKSGTILSITKDGMVKLSFTVPASYSMEKLARMYKML